MASKNIYSGDSNGIARETKKILRGDENGIARTVKKVLYGDEDGIARLVYGGGNPYPIPLTELQIEILKGAYNVNNQNIITFANNGYKQAWDTLDNVIRVCQPISLTYAGFAIDNDCAYFINSQTYAVSLYDANLTVNKSENTYQFYKVGVYYLRMVSTTDWNSSTYQRYCYDFGNQNLYNSGSFAGLTSKWWEGNTYSGKQMNRNLDNALMMLWGSKNIPIYIGDSIANAKLLPDPSKS